MRQKPLRAVKVGLAFECFERIKMPNQKVYPNEGFTTNNEFVIKPQIGKQTQKNLAYLSLPLKIQSEP